MHSLFISLYSMEAKNRCKWNSFSQPVTSSEYEGGLFLHSQSLLMSLLYFFILSIYKALGSLPWLVIFLTWRYLVDDADGCFTELSEQQIHTEHVTEDHRAASSFAHTSFQHRHCPFLNHPCRHHCLLGPYHSHLVPDQRLTHVAHWFLDRTEHWQHINCSFLYFREYYYLLGMNNDKYSAILYEIS